MRRQFLGWTLLIAFTARLPCPADRAWGGPEIAAVCLSIYPGATYETGSPPVHMTVGNFDPDGILDLALATNAGLAVLRGAGSAGLGDGTFGAPSPYAQGMPARFVAAADLDEDGRLDLLASFASGVGLLLGQPGGTFAPPMLYPASVQPEGIATADFNQDGILDVAVANRLSGDVSVLLGTGTNGIAAGTFAPAVQCTVGGTLTRIVALRTAPDADPDLAVLDEAGQRVVLLQGVAGGLFSIAGSTAVGAVPRDLVVGDFNEDGQADLAVSNGAANNISVLLGNGTTFQAGITYPAAGSPRDVVAADFNGDGMTDLATPLYNSGRVALLTGRGSQGKGDGTFDFPFLYLATSQPGPLVAGEFLKDGAPDVAAGSTSSAAVATLLNGCLPGTPLDLSLSAANSEHPALIGGPLALSWTRGTGITAVRLEVSYDQGSIWEPIGTIDFGTSLEWTVTAPATPQAWIRIYDPLVPERADTLGSAKICSLLGSPIASDAIPGVVQGTLGDFNEDGIRDLVLVTTGSEIAILLGQGSGGIGNGAFALLDTIGTGRAFGLATGDFDEDGILDLALSLSEGIGILRGQGAGGVGNGHFGPLDLLPSGGGVGGVVAEDFDEDGVLDIAAVNGAANRVSIYFGQGTFGEGSGAFAAPTFHPVEKSLPREIEAGDFDRDGILDLVIAASNGCALLRGQGSGGRSNGMFGAAVSLVGLPSPAVIATGDFAEDGTADLLVGVYVAGGGIWLMRSFSSSTSLEPAELFGAPDDLVVGEFDNDGILDLGYSLSSGNAALLRLGRGSNGIGTGGFSSGGFLPDGQGSGLVVGDVVEDGHHDLLRISPTHGTVSVLPGTCGLETPGTIEVVSPNGGETLLPLSEATIQWSKSLEISSVDVELSRDGGVRWEPLAQRQTGTSFTWSVTPPLGGPALLRVSKSDAPSIFDVSDAPFQIGGTATGVLPQVTAASLSVPHPNPFRKQVSLSLVVPLRVMARAAVYDATGRQVRSLASGELDPGRYTLRWDGRDAFGSEQRAGIYFARVQWNGFEAVRRVVLLR